MERLTVFSNNPSNLPVARRQGGTESRDDGKHVGVQALVSSSALRGLVPRPSGTAVYEPIRTVVWDPWLALAVSHRDPIRFLVPGADRLRFHS